VPSANYQTWHAEQETEFMINRRKWGVPTEPIKKCSMNIIITFPDRIKADLTNKAESIMDLLVDLGVLEDDSHFNCDDLRLISGGVDKKTAGAIVDIFYK